MLSTAFTLWGAPVTFLEIVAFVLSLACIVCNVREIHWGWPLTIASSALYAWLFAAGKIYGEASVNVFFALSGLWGWWQWLYGKRRDETQNEGVLEVERLPPRYWMHLTLAWLIGWGAIGVLLKNVTDSSVPFFDAFPTMGSVIGTVLLARKFVENWPVWVVVNTASIALFAYKQFYLTVLLYGIFTLMAVWGWQRWRTLLSTR